MRRFLALAAGLSTSWAAYCDAGNVVSGDSTLGAVNLVGDTLTIDDTENKCPNPTGLQNRLSFKADLRVGGQYTLKFYAATCALGFVRFTYAFIDYNCNDLFESPSELVGSQAVSDSTSPYEIIYQFTVPPGAVTGKDTRMRVFVVESGSSAAPCLQFSYGGVKDYSIVLTQGTPPTPAVSCCLPTTYSSIARVRNGATVNVIFQWQNFQKQAYLQRTEVPGSESSNSMLCLAASQACWGFTETTCQKYSFVWPAQECPGANSSKFVFDSKSSLIPGIELTIYKQTEVAITTLPLQTWCVYDAIVPSTAFTYWDLEPPAAVFVVPSYCTQDSEAKPLPESSFFGVYHPSVRST